MTPYLDFLESDWAGRGYSLLEVYYGRSIYYYYTAFWDRESRVNERAQFDEVFQIYGRIRGNADQLAHDIASVLVVGFPVFMRRIGCPAPSSDIYELFLPTRDTEEWSPEWVQDLTRPLRNKPMRTGVLLSAMATIELGLHATWLGDEFEFNTGQPTLDSYLTEFQAAIRELRLPTPQRQIALRTARGD